MSPQESYGVISPIIFDWKVDVAEVVRRLLDHQHAEIWFRESHATYFTTTSA